MSRWTDAEKARVAALWNAGVDHQTIADEFGCSYSAIAGLALRLRKAGEDIAHRPTRHLCDVCRKAIYYDTRVRVRAAKEACRQ